MKVELKQIMKSILEKLEVSGRSAAIYCSNEVTAEQFLVECSEQFNNKKIQNIYGRKLINEIKSYLVVQISKRKIYTWSYFNNFNANSKKVKTEDQDRIASWNDFSERTCRLLEELRKTAIKGKWLRHFNYAKNDADKQIIIRAGKIKIAGSLIISQDFRGCILFSVVPNHSKENDEEARQIIYRHYAQLNEIGYPALLDAVGYYLSLATPNP